MQESADLLCSRAFSRLCGHMRIVKGVLIMGWTGYTPTNFKNGKVDRKAEIDAQYTCAEGQKSYGYQRGLRVLKSQMVGSVYYGAIETTDSRNHERDVICAVVLTRYQAGEFYYKSMDESMGPAECKCPVGILNLLTPTRNEYANSWRMRCREYQQSKREMSITKLPLGSIISFPWNGTVMRVQKMHPAYQFKTPWWLILGENKYFHKNKIPQTFEIERTGWGDDGDA